MLNVYVEKFNAEANGGVMKIYTKVTINMRTLEEVKLECYEYAGLVVECKGGGGGSGGTGKVSYPAYMETMHGTWLTDMDGYMDAAIGNSPFTTATAYDPDTDLAAMDTAITAFNTVVDAISVATDYASYSAAVKNQVDNNVISTTKIDADITAYAAVLDSDYDDLVTKLQSGMRDIGAAMTSSFVVGQADLYAKKERDVTEFGKRLYVEAERQRNEMITTGTTLVFQAHLQRAALEESVARLTADAKRIRIVAKSEETKENYDYDEVDAKWDLSMGQYGANMLSAIGGGSVSTESGKGMSKTQSALSGAMSGAAAGTMVMPGWGTAIGAVAGGIGGYLSA